MVQIHSPRPFFYGQQLTRIRIVNERLVAGQEVNRSSVFAPTILSPLIAIRYAAFSTGTPASFCGQYGQDLWFCLKTRGAGPTKA
jgi:hypothetical protein